ARRPSSSAATIRAAVAAPPSPRTLRSARASPPTPPMEWSSASAIATADRRLVPDPMTRARSWASESAGGPSRISRSRGRIASGQSRMGMPAVSARRCAAQPIGSLGGRGLLRDRLDLPTGVHGPVALVEVLRAVRADVPFGADELRAGRAHALEAGAAGRAEDEVLLHALVAGRGDDALLRLGEQALLRELPLVGLADRFAGTDDEVDEEPEDRHRRDEQRREHREQAVLGAVL